MGYGTVNIGYQPKPEKTVLTLTHSKSETIHTLAGLPDGFGLFTAQFKATADFVAGDTFAGGYTAKPTGEETALPDKAFISGDLVTVSVDKTRKMFYFSVGISGDFLPLSGGTMTGPAVGAPGAIATPQFRNVQYGTEQLVEGVSELPEGTLYITPEVDGIGSSLPSGGIPGQVLTKTVDGAEWATAPGQTWAKVQDLEFFTIYKSSTMVAIYFKRLTNNFFDNISPTITTKFGISYISWYRAFRATDGLNPEYAPSAGEVFGFTTPAPDMWTFKANGGRDNFSIGVEHKIQYIGDQPPEQHYFGSAPILIALYPINRSL